MSGIMKKVSRRMHTRLDYDVKIWIFEGEYETQIKDIMK